MPQIPYNIVFTDDDGLHYIPSGSDFFPLLGTNSVPQSFAITASSTGNQLVHPSELNPHIIITVLSGSNTRDGLDVIEVIRYHTASFDLDNSPFGFSSSLFFTSSNRRARYKNIPVLSTDNSATIATKTYNAITSSTFINKTYSASLNANNHIIINFNVSGSFPPPVIYSASIDDDSLSFNFIQTGSGLLNFVEEYQINVASSSLSIKRDPDDKNSTMFSVGTGSFSHVSGSSEKVILYASSSGKIGIDTKDPLTDFDIRADEFQIKRKLEDKGLKINREGNIESFDKSATSAATGSEFILNYSRGININANFINTIFGGGSVSSDEDAVAFFNSLTPDEQQNILKKGEERGFITPPSSGDTLGQIRWVAESGSISSFDKRGAGEAATIKAVVSDVAADGIRTDLIFSVASRTGAAAQKFLLDAGNSHELTGSLNIAGGLTATSTATFTQNVTFNGNIKGDGAGAGNSNVEDIDSISGFGNLSMGNNGNEVHQLIGDVYIKRVSSDGGDLYFQSGGSTKLKVGYEGTISASGFISASSFSGDGSGLTNVTATATIPAGTYSSSLQTLGNITSSGNISASGTITALSSNIITIDGGSF